MVLNNFAFILLNLKVPIISLTLLNILSMSFYELINPVAVFNGLYYVQTWIYMDIHDDRKRGKLAVS